MNVSIRSTALAALFTCCVTLSTPAQTSAPVLYGLRDTSGYTEGCYPPCLCPIFFAGGPSGTFTLRYVASDPAGFDHYLVENVNWVLDIFGTPSHVTGGGTYKRGGAVAITEQMTLALSFNGGANENFDSGLVVPQQTFPRLAITLSMNGMVCYDKVFELASAPKFAGAGYCFGDGTGTACPCANAGAPGNGCASSVNPSGANLVGLGVASVSGDSVVLVSSGTPSAPALFFQGTQRVNGSAGSTFGDGLLCAGGILTRLKVTIAVAGEARVPAGVDPALSILGGIVVPGTYDYQVWYRESPPFCTPATYNLTNGYEITWTN